MASSVPATSNPLIPDDNESEWEYEYSTTETETFYVTLDLSKADFTARDPVTLNTNPNSYEAGKETEIVHHRRKSAANLDAENEDDDDYERQQQGSQNGKQSSNKEGGEGREGEEAHRVQILELHSPNPVISYKGRVYTGQWCQNVGTELLLTRRDSSASSSSLSALRHLRDGVDLLAASSARINVREQELKPRDGAAGGKEGRKPSYGPAADVPPPDRGATRERYQQGRFLADLIALKRRRGETDEVTVVAKNVHRRKSAKKEEDNRSKGGQLPGSGSGSGRATTGKPRGVGKERGGGRGVGRGRGRGKGGRGGLHALRELSLGAESIGSSTAPSWAASLDGTAGSTPTPGHWDGLGEDDVPTPPMQDHVEEDREEDGKGESDDDDDDDEGADEDLVSGSSGDDEDGDDDDDMDVDED
ncbi:hypothetical protein F5X99DRAFT_409053 [Biscogniauxia marginata]|nr:hypothetical protein F5X99DRAFT_409053 [Biscogniauxia marginata]